MGELYEGLCEAECQHFHGGEVRHHKDCGHYPESLTRLFEDRIEALEVENARLKTALRPFVEYVHDDLRKSDHRYRFERTIEMGGGWVASEDLRRAHAALKGDPYGQA